MNGPPVLVLIVNYRTAALTLGAIRSILPQVRAQSGTRIFVIDNGSGDGSPEILKSGLAQLAAGDVCDLVELQDNLGFAAGNNAGLQLYQECFGAWPGLTWLLNPDTIAEPGALGALIAFMDSRGTAGIAGGLCHREDGSIRPSAFRFHTPLNEAVAALDFGPLRRLFRNRDVVMPVTDAPSRAEWLSGSHLMVRGEVFDTIGLFDPGYFLYFEETDFCARAADAGFEAWYVPASRITHLGGRATGLGEFGSPDRRPRYWFASRGRFMRRRYGSVRTHVANLLWLLMTPMGMLLAKVRGKRRQDPPRFWRDFLCHNYGPRGVMYQGREDQP